MLKSMKCSSPYRADPQRLAEELHKLLVYMAPSQPLRRIVAFKGRVPGFVKMSIRMPAGRLVEVADPFLTDRLRGKMA